MALGLFGETEWQRRINLVFNRGFVNFDGNFVCFQILVPVMIALLDALLVPFFVSRLLCTVVESYQTQTLLVRMAFPSYFLVRILAVVGVRVYVALAKLHNEIRDSRYLLGTELTNR